MNMFFRVLWHLWVARRAKPLDVLGLSRTSFRVQPADLDVYRHMNNGRYLSLLDLGRLDLLVRTGLWRTFNRLGWYPVVAAQTITYRRSLTLGQRFTVETRIAGGDTKSVIIEQRFVSGGQLVAHAFVRARFLKRSGGTLGTAEVLEAIGVAALPTDRLPDWVSAWSAASALPPARADVPSEYVDAAR